MSKKIEKMPAWKSAGIFFLTDFFCCKTIENTAL